MSATHRTLTAAALVALCVATPAAAGTGTAAGSGLAQGFMGDRARGWFWYEDPPPPPAETPLAETPPPAAQAVDPDPNSDAAMIARMEAFQNQVKAARARAFLEPTSENVHNMAALQTSFVQRASDVADVWQRTIWANPEFDFTLERPVNPLGLAAYEAERKQTRTDTLERLAAEHVFYFFFKSDCPYCHAFSPTLQAFSIASGISVFPVSLDAGGLPEFPQPALDNGMSATLGVTTVPALFLANPRTGVIMPVGYGVLNEMDLAQRIVAIANETVPDAVRAATPVQRLTPIQHYSTSPVAEIRR